MKLGLQVAKTLMESPQDWHEIETVLDEFSEEILVIVNSYFPKIADDVFIALISKKIPNTVRQNGYLKAKSQNKAGSYIRTVAHNYCKDLLKKEINVIPIIDDHDTEDSICRDQIRRVEFSIDYEIALNRLVPNQRDAFALLMEGHSYVEIAKQLDTTTKKVKGRIYRARQNMKEFFENY